MAKSLPTERAYETLLIFPSDLPQKSIDGFIEKIKTTLSPTKGVLRGVQVWGRRRLTYPVKHQKDGLYVYIDYTGTPTAPESLKNLFRVTDFVLRHMTTEKVVLRPPWVPRRPTVTAETPEATATATTPPAAPPAEPTKELPSA